MADPLVELLVSAYRPYVEATLRIRQIDLTPVTDVLDQGEAWLERALSELMDTPFAQQRRGPLEVFQEAIRFPTVALQAAGVPPARRDEVTAHALPGDVYDLAPASSRDLGEDVWHAHLAWGARKAQALRDGD